VLLLTIWAFATGGFSAVANFGAPQWIAVGYLGLFGSALTFILWVFALSRASPTRTAVTVTINPIFASAVGALASARASGSI
jgi:drug/metabolite transporter (DMT)-like permease